MRRLLGIGNSFRGDDAAGIQVAQAAGGIPMESPDALELMSAWEGAGEVVLVDAVRSGRPAGTIHRLDASDCPLPADLFACDSHCFGLAQGIELGRALGKLPSRVLVFGIEGKSFVCGEPLSPEVRQAVDTLVWELRDGHE